MSTPGEFATSTVSTPTPGEVATSTASTGERECITAEKITTPVKAANVNKDYAYLLKFFQKINNVNPVAVPSASATAAPVAVASASVEDKKKNEEIEERGDEESDDDMGFSLYD